jgi:hypothetical protein
MKQKIGKMLNPIVLLPPKAFTFYGGPENPLKYGGLRHSVGGQGVCKYEQPGLTLLTLLTNFFSVYEHKDRREIKVG